MVNKQILAGVVNSKKKISLNNIFTRWINIKQKLRITNISIRACPKIFEKYN